MTNHPNRGWRARWSVNLNSATATHRDGWEFKFSPTSGQPGVFDGKCTKQPAQISTELMLLAPRIAKEAGEIYIEARNARH